MHRKASVARRRALLAAFVLGAGSAGAEPFAFAPAPQQDLNRLYRIDTFTGEVSACQFAITDQNTIGVTLCYPAGEGARAGEPGDYALVPSSHRQEAGIFRVDKRSGKVSICYVRADQDVVCTPPVK